MSHLDISTSTQGDAVIVKLVGSIDRYSDFAPVIELQASKIYLDLRGVQRITSGGVQIWARFIHDLAASHDVELHACSSSFVKQLNMVAGVAPYERVQSCMLPYFCEECGFDIEVLADIETARARAEKSVACPECGAGMEFDDIVDSYFAWMRHIGTKTAL